MERKYHVKDMLEFLAHGCLGPWISRKQSRWPSKAEKAKLSSDAVQEWFQSGLRRCDKHPYPYLWHVTAGEECSKCKEANEANPT